MGKHFTKAVLCITGVCCVSLGALLGTFVQGMDEVHAAETKMEQTQETDTDAQTVPKDARLVSAGQPKNGLMDITMNATDVLGKLVDESRLFYAGDYEGKFVVNVEPYLEIRTEAGDTSEVLGKLYPASSGTVESWGEEWTKITSGSVTGYIPTKDASFGYDAEQLANEIGTKVVTVTADSLNVRSEADVNSEVVATAVQNEEFRVVKPEEEDTNTNEESEETKQDVAAKPSDDTEDNTSDSDWVYISYNDDESAKGYVAREYVEERIELPPAVSLEEEKAAEEAAKAEEEAKAAEAEAAEAAKTTNTDNSTGSSSGGSGSASTTNETPVYADTDETYLLACMIYVESGAESYAGQLAVGNVIMNRVRSSLFPNTISEVIYQSGQFPGAHNGVLDGVLASGPSDSCMQAAQEALAGINNIGDYLYFNGWVDPSTVSSYLTIENQTFYNY